MIEFAVRVIAPEDLTDVEFKRALEAVGCLLVAQPTKGNRPALKAPALPLRCRPATAPEMA